MKRVLALVLIVMLMGCQANTQKQMVDAPKQWKNTLKRNGEKVVLQADIELKIPELANIPVIEVERATFGNKELKNLTSYFADGNQIYERQRPLQSEVEHKLEEMKARKGIWGHPWWISYVSSWLGNASEKLEEASKSDGKRRYVEPVFRTPYTWETGGYRNEELEKEAFYFDVVVEKEASEDVVNPQIKAMSYNEKADSNSFFHYVTGSGFSASDNEDWSINLNQFETNKEGSEEWRISYREYLETMKQVMSNPDISEAMAREKTESILKDLNITELGEISVEPCAWIPDTLEGGNPMTADWSKAQFGYEIVYGRISGGLRSYQQPRGIAAMYLPEKVYAPPFFQEMITMIVTKDGLVEFAWDNMTKVCKTISKSTSLLSFEEIEEKLADHLLSFDVATDEVNGFEANSNSNRYVVTNVELRASYINSNKKSQRAQLVPTWVFTMDWYRKTKGNGNKEVLREPQIVLLNAIDGGYIALTQEEIVQMPR